MNNFLFLDTNYLEFSTFSGSYNSASLKFCYDNRGDTGYTLFGGSAGSMTVDLGVTLTTDTYMVLGNNFTTGRLLYSQDNITYTTLTNFATSSAYFLSTITARYWKLECVQASTTGSFSEFIVTKQKFRLNTNPSFGRFNPGIDPIGGLIDYWNGKSRRIDNTIEGVFTAEIGWNYLEGNVNSMTGTDLQNVTELVRRKTSFLFHIHGGSSTAGTFPDLYSWRKDDIFKCRIDSPVRYQLSVKGRLDYINALYRIVEAK